MILWRREESVEKKLERYFDECDNCFERVRKALEVYFDKGPGDGRW